MSALPSNASFRLLLHVRVGSLSSTAMDIKYLFSIISKKNFVERYNMTHPFYLLGKYRTNKHHMAQLFWKLTRQKIRALLRREKKWFASNENWIAKPLNINWKWVSHRLLFNYCLKWRTKESVTMIFTSNINGRIKLIVSMYLLIHSFFNSNYLYKTFSNIVIVIHLV